MLLLSLEWRIQILSRLTCLQFRLKSQFEWEEHYKLQNTVFETSDCWVHSSEVSPDFKKLFDGLCRWKLWLAPTWSLIHHPISEVLTRLNRSWFKTTSWWWEMRAADGIWRLMGWPLLCYFLCFYVLFFSATTTWIFNYGFTIPSIRTRQLDFQDSDFLSEMPPDVGVSAWKLRGTSTIPSYESKYGDRMYQHWVHVINHTLY